MLVAQQPVALGVVWYTLIAVAPVALLLLALRMPRLVAAVRGRRSAKRAEPVSVGPPIELLAVDLWRLRSELVTQPPTNYVRRTALLSAYDSVLAATCARLEIRTELGSVSSWQDLELERLRAEAAIEQAGLPLVRP